MKTSKDIIMEMTRLYNEYQQEIEALRKNGILKQSAANTYLLHSKNFVRWCKDEFEPGRRNIGK